MPSPGRGRTHQPQRGGPCWRRILRTCSHQRGASAPMVLFHYNGLGAKATRTNASKARRASRGCGLPTEPRLVHLHAMEGCSRQLRRTAAVNQLSGRVRCQTDTWRSRASFRACARVRLAVSTCPLSSCDRKKPSRCSMEGEVVSRIRHCSPSKPRQRLGPKHVPCERRMHRFRE